jgi:hypothetical protein
MAQWLDELQAQRAGDNALKPYPDAEGVAARLMKTNARLDPDKAEWLAQHWARPGPDGQWRILGDSAHKVINPYLFHVEEALAMYGRISAPVLVVEASDDSLSQWWKGRYTLAEFHERLKAVPQLEKAVIQDSDDAIDEIVIFRTASFVMLSPFQHQLLRQLTALVGTETHVSNINDLITHIKIDGVLTVPTITSVQIDPRWEKVICSVVIVHSPVQIYFHFESAKALVVKLLCNFDVKLRIRIIHGQPRQTGDRVLQRKR